jgi:polysaccharide export outer membrane protein
VPVTPPDASFHSRVPRELDKVSLPPYVIEPPDILMINATKIVPKPPYRLEPFDAIIVRVVGTLPGEEIGDAYYLDPEGKIDLGPTYGRVLVTGLTIDEAEAAIRRHLSVILANPVVSVSLAFSAGAQQIVGEHLVGMDGRVNLGSYGWVHVAGMTIDDARTTIEKHLAQYLDKPEVIVDIFSYNSKKYYIITQGAGLGDNVVESPITGNECVLDGIARVGGLSQLSSSKIWIARPAPNGVGCEQILPVNWADITQGARTETNYQLMPGDRLFIADDPMLRFNNFINKTTQPFERLFGFVSLGTAMANRITRYGLGTQ